MPDVAFCINRALHDSGVGNAHACVNAAVEESTLADRGGDALLAQDMFVREHYAEGDTLVLSVPALEYLEARLTAPIRTARWVDATARRAAAA